MPVNVSKPMKTRPYIKIKNNGLSLIEVLVTIVVISLGMFSMLGVFMNGLKLGSSSNYRTIAAEQAYAMAETLRANPLTLGTSASDAVFSSASANVVTSCMQAGGCARTDFVNTAFGMWQQGLATVLQQGTGTVCRDDNPAGNSPDTTTTPPTWNCSGKGQYVIKICWNESRIGASKQAVSASGFLCQWTNI